MVEAIKVQVISEAEKKVKKDLDTFKQEMRQAKQKRESKGVPSDPSNE
jgi:hypothetical protein